MPLLVVGVLFPLWAARAPRAVEDRVGDEGGGSGSGASREGGDGDGGDGDR